MEKFCYHGNTIGAKGGAVDSVITKIRSEWFKFRDSVFSLASRALTSGAKSRS